MTCNFGATDNYHQIYEWYNECCYECCVRNVSYNLTHIVYHYFNITQKKCLRQDKYRRRVSLPFAKFALRTTRASYPRNPSLSSSALCICTSLSMDPSFINMYPSLMMYPFWITLLMAASWPSREILEIENNLPLIYSNPVCLLFWFFMVDLFKGVHVEDRVTIVPKESPLRQQVENFHGVHVLSTW